MIASETKIIHKVIPAIFVSTTDAELETTCTSVKPGSQKMTMRCIDIAIRHVVSTAYISIALMKSYVG